MIPVLVSIQEHFIIRIRFEHSLPGALFHGDCSEFLILRLNKRSCLMGRARQICCEVTDGVKFPEKAYQGELPKDFVVKEKFEFGSPTDSPTQNVMQLRGPKERSLGCFSVLTRS